MSKYNALVRFDEEDNLIIEVFKYNLFRNRLNKIVTTTKVFKDDLIKHYSVK